MHKSVHNIAAQQCILECIGGGENGVRGIHTLSASLRSLVRSTILGLGPNGILSISLSRVALPLEPPPPDRHTDNDYCAFDSAAATKC